MTTITENTGHKEPESMIVKIINEEQKPNNIAVIVKDWEFPVFTVEACDNHHLVAIVKRFKKTTVSSEPSPYFFLEEVDAIIRAVKLLLSMYGDLRVSVVSGQTENKPLNDLMQKINAALK